MQYAGLAAGLFGFFRFFVSTIVALLFIHLVNSGIRLIIMMLITAALALVVYSYGSRGNR